MEQTVVVDCQDCPFGKKVGPDDDDLPADVLIAHGEAKGHQLQIKRNGA